MSLAGGWLNTAAYAAGWQVIRAMPAPLAGRLFTAAADLAVRRDARSVRQLRRNLARVAGPRASSAELDQLVRAGMRSYARYWLETFRLPSMDVDKILPAYEV